MKRKLYIAYRVIMGLIIWSWIISDFAKTIGHSNPIQEFWATDYRYLIILGWVLFDLGWLWGRHYQKVQQRKGCTLRHANDPKRHNFVGAQCNSSEPSRNYKHAVVESVNQEIKK